MRSLPQDNLAYPILITLDSGGQGTGCIINCQEGNYLATAKHVIADNQNALKGAVATLKSYTPDLIETDFTQLTLNLDVISTNSKIKFHPVHDVCLIQLMDNNESGMNPSIGVTVDQISSFGVCGINIDKTVKLFSEVLISNDVFIFGYPSSIGLKSSPQFNSDMPLLRKGIVAGKNSSNSTIILDCPVYPGNSGGPVIEVEVTPGGINFKLLGLVVQFVPVVEQWKSLLYNTVNSQLTNSGYSIVVPVDFVKEVINQF